MRPGFLPRLGGVALLLGLLVACAEEGTVATGVTAAAAQAPTLTAIELQQTANSILTLRARATSPAGTALTYAWTVDAGRLSSSSAATVQWLAPTAAGTYTATVTVSNPAGGRVTGTQRFTVASTGGVTAGALQLDSRAAATATPSAGTTVVSSNRQGVATPVPGLTPLPAPLPAVVATPVPTPPVQNPVASVLPTGQPPTPQPGVPVPPPLRWQLFPAAKVPAAAGTAFLAVHFPKPTRGWFAGTAGTVLLYNETTPGVEPAMVFRNGGLPATGRATDVHFVSDDVGFLVMTDDVYRTVDAGVSWQPINGNLKDFPGAVNALVVQNAQVVSVGLSNGDVYRAENANVTEPGDVFWTSMPTKPGDRPADATTRLRAGAASPTDATVTYFGGDALFRLDTDAAADQRWKRVLSMDTPLPNTPDLGDGEVASIRMPSASEIWVGTTNGNMLISSDGGGTWRRIHREKFKDREFNGNRPNLPQPGPIRAMSVLDGARAFFGAGADVYDTVDAGASWRKLGASDLADLDVFVTTVNGKPDFRGWGVAGTIILHYKDGL